MPAWLANGNQELYNRDKRSSRAASEIAKLGMWRHLDNTESFTLSVQTIVPVIFAFPSQKAVLAPLVLTRQAACHGFITSSWLLLEDLHYPSLSTESSRRSVRRERRPASFMHVVNTLFSRTLENSTCGTICVVTHAPTFYIYARYLLNITHAVPTREELDCVGQKIPYCSSVVLEKVSKFQMSSTAGFCPYITRATLNFWIFPREKSFRLPKLRTLTFQAVMTSFRQQLGDAANSASQCWAILKYFWIPKPISAQEILAF